jgi:hypothetical protein
MNAKKKVLIINHRLSLEKKVCQVFLALQLKHGTMASFHIFCQGTAVQGMAFTPPPPTSYKNIKLNTVRLSMSMMFLGVSELGYKKIACSNHNSYRAQSYKTFSRLFRPLALLI